MKHMHLPSFLAIMELAKGKHGFKWHVHRSVGWVVLHQVKEGDKGKKSDCQIHTHAPKDRTAWLRLRIKCLYVVKSFTANDVSSLFFVCLKRKMQQSVNSFFYELFTNWIRHTCRAPIIRYKTGQDANLLSPSPQKKKQKLNKNHNASMTKTENTVIKTQHGTCIWNNKVSAI